MLIIAAMVLVGFGIYFFRQKKHKPDNSNKEHYQELLQANVVFYQKLNADGKLKFEKMVGILLSDIRIEGVGTEVSELDKVLIASSAVIPIFGFPGWRYKNLTNVILYPDTFDNEFQFEGGGRNILGMVGSGYMNGQMILSRTALLKGFSKEHGMENTAIHEFVHLLDSADGATDGIPENLLKHEYAIPWVHLMHVEMHKISEGKSDINPYALTNEAEFFAVVAEYFFEKPEQFQIKTPGTISVIERNLLARLDLLIEANLPLL